jgi:hypothetical protein
MASERYFCANVDIFFVKRWISVRTLVRWKSVKPVYLQLSTIQFQLSPVIHEVIHKLIHRE